MNPVLVLAERFIIGKIIQAPLIMPDRSPVGHLLILAAAIFALTGAGFMLFSAHLWLNDHYRPDLAAAMMGLAAFLMATLAALSAGMFFYFRYRMIRKIKSEIDRTVHDIAGLIDDFLSDPVRENPKTSVTLAALAGFLLGEKGLS